MDEIRLATVLGNALGTGSAVAVLLLIIAKIAKGVVERWIAALDQVKAEVSDHTKRDLESHRTLGTQVAAGISEIKEQQVRIETKLDSGLNWLDRDRDRTPNRTPDRSGPHRRRRDTDIE